MTFEELIYLPIDEKIRRFDAMCGATFSHVDGRDLLAELHPRHEIDIKRRVDGRETWFEGDWLSVLMDARNGPRIVAPVDPNIPAASPTPESGVQS